MHYDNEPEQGMHGAEAVAHFLDRKHASFELIQHYATYAAREEASAAGSPAPRMAKTVVLSDTDGYRIAIIPASERVDLDKAREVFGASADMRLATEDEIVQEFPHSILALCLRSGACLERQRCSTPACCTTTGSFAALATIAIPSRSLPKRSSEWANRPSRTFASERRPSTEAIPGRRAALSTLRLDDCFAQPDVVELTIALATMQCSRRVAVMPGLPTSGAVEAKSGTTPRLCRNTSARQRGGHASTGRSRRRGRPRRRARRPAHERGTSRQARRCVPTFAGVVTATPPARAPERDGAGRTTWSSSRSRPQSRSARSRPSRCLPHPATAANAAAASPPPAAARAHAGRRPPSEHRRGYDRRARANDGRRGRARTR